MKSVDDHISKAWRPNFRMEVVGGAEEVSNDVDDDDRDEDGKSKRMWCNSCCYKKNRNAHIDHIC